MKKKGIIAAAGLAAVALVGGTFAYFTQSTTIDNPFDTGIYKTVAFEDFNPDDGEKWKPGAEVNKDVYVQNTGDQPVVVRVKFEEKWTRTNEDGEVTAKKENDSVVTTKDVMQEDPTDGWIGRDGTVVEKKFHLSGPREDGNVWSDRQSDGWYYYYTLLEPEKVTEKLLDSVTLSKDVDLGAYYSTVYYRIGVTDDRKPFDATDDEWKQFGERIPGKISTVTADMMKKIKEAVGEIPVGQTLYTTVVAEPDPDALGYSDADYVLSITIETVQATDQAVLGTFFPEGIPDDELKEIYDNWKLEPEKLPEVPVGTPSEP